MQCSRDALHPVWSAPRSGPGRKGMFVKQNLHWLRNNGENTPPICRFDAASEERGLRWRS
eukprot:357359-Pyramimonas_sp.AAC.1